MFAAIPMEQRSEEHTHSDSSAWVHTSSTFLSARCSVVLSCCTLGSSWNPEMRHWACPLSPSEAKWWIVKDERLERDVVTSQDTCLGKQNCFVPLHRNLYFKLRVPQFCTEIWLWPNSWHWFLPQGKQEAMLSERMLPMQYSKSALPSVKHHVPTKQLCRRLLCLSPLSPIPTILTTQVCASTVILTASGASAGAVAAAAACRSQSCAGEGTALVPEILWSSVAFHTSPVPSPGSWEKKTLKGLHLESLVTATLANFVRSRANNQYANTLFIHYAFTIKPAKPCAKGSR